jgi:hypothetical protein
MLREAAKARLRKPGPLCDEHSMSIASETAGRYHDAFKAFVLASGAGGLAAKAVGIKTAHIFYDQLLFKPTHSWQNNTSYWKLNLAERFTPSGWN